MRILLSHRYDLLNPEINSFPDSVRQSFERKGHHVVAVGCNHPYPTPVSVPEYQSFDVLVHIDNGRQGWEMTQGIDQFKGLKVCWLTHLHSQYPACRDVAKQFDIVFATIYGAIDRLARDTGKHAIWLPEAADQFKVFPAPNDYSPKYDIGFVGRRRGRADILRQVVVKHPDIRCYVGEAWGDAYREAIWNCNAIFNKHLPGQALANDFNNRVFETMACRRLLITDANVEKGQEQLFKNGVHYLTYKDAAELERHVMASVSDPAMRERIAEAGYREFLAYHTFDHRVDVILKSIDDFSQRKPQGRAP